MRTTKKQIIEIISSILKDHPEKEISVAKYQNKLRNGRWGLHAYAICYNSGSVMCRPWSGANCYWNARLDRLTKGELEDIVGKTIMSTKP